LYEAANIAYSLSLFPMNNIPGAKYLVYTYSLNNNDIDYLIEMLKTENCLVLMGYTTYYSDKGISSNKQT